MQENSKQNYLHGAQTPISNDDHANALGCSNSGLENCVCVSKQKG